MDNTIYIIAVRCQDDDNFIAEFYDPADLMNFFMDMQDKGCPNEMAIAVLD